MIKPKVLIKGKFYADDIVVTVNPVSNRKIDQALESKIEPAWQEIYTKAKADGKQVWDGDTCRLNKFHIDKKGKLHLETSAIKFSVRYCLSRMTTRLEGMSEDYYSKGLGIGGLIKTLDSQFIFGERSGKTMTNGGIGVIGGCIEDGDASSGQNLFVRNVEEIREELGVEKEFIKTMYICGMILTDMGNVLLPTFTELNITSKQVQEAFEQNADEEMSNLMFVEEGNLKDYLLLLWGDKLPIVDLLKYLF